MIPSHKTIKSVPLSRVELHVHLDGAVRHETIWELAKKKNVKLPGQGTFRELLEAVVVRDPVDLGHFLKPFLIFSPCIVGDLEAIERVAYEFCEDEASNGVAYVEARYSPHFWLSDKDVRGRIEDLGEVVKAVHRGFTRGEADFKVKARSILCALNGTGTIDDVFVLSKKYKGEGVVGIDIAAMCSDDSKTYVEVPLNPDALRVYDEARKCGIHRTVHAGESGGPEMVQRAVEDYHTERVGHGYHVLQDLSVYANCLEKDIHFEACPYSSLLTGSVPLNCVKHPIVQFAEDEANFSINTDDPTVTGMHLQDDFHLTSSWGLTEAHHIRATLNAARSCFLPTDEKNQLIQSLYKTFGFSDVNRCKWSLD